MYQQLLRLHSHPSIRNQKTGMKHRVQIINIATCQRNSTCKSTRYKLQHQSNRTFTIFLQFLRNDTKYKSRLLQPTRSKRTKRFTPFGLPSRPVQQVARYRRNRKLHGTRDTKNSSRQVWTGTETNMCQAHLVVPHACCKERRDEGESERKSTDGLGFSNERHELSGIPRSR